MNEEWSENEETFDTIGFNRAVQALSTVDILKKAQEAANELTKSDISVCFTTLGVNEHIVYFIIDDKEDISRENREALRARLCTILEYDAITLLRKNPSSNMTLYSRLVLASPENHAEIVGYLKEYRNYIERKPLTGSTSFKETLQSNAHAYEALGLMPSPKKPKTDEGATLSESYKMSGAHGTI